jgi:STE24 endopeptidase
VLTLILSLLLFRFLLDTVADTLNLRNMTTSLPEEFLGIYDAEKYRTSLLYQRENTRFALISRTVFVGATLAFLLLGGFDDVDRIARGLGYGTLTTGLLFVGILALLKGTLQLPFALYDTFVIEEKYGFNKTTLGVFVQDLLRGTLLGVLLGAPAFAGIVWFFERTGDRAWLYAWAALSVFQLAVLFLAPVVILPLFNKFQPVPEGELRTAIEDYARRSHFQLQGVFTMDASKRSTKANAFFTGFGRFRRLVLFDTLIEKHTTEELVAVFAHEVGHFKRGHIGKGILLSILISAVVFRFVGFIVTSPELAAAFGLEQVSVYAGLVFAGFLYSPVLRLLSFGSNALSRKFEFEADAYARETYGKPEALASALKKLSRDTFSNLTPHPFKVALDYSHPPVLKRVQALRGSPR